MVLSDRTIKQKVTAGAIRIEPLDPDDIQPSSVDLHLGDHFQVFRNSRYPYIDPSREQSGLMELVEATPEDPFVLHPGEFVLGTTVERVVLPDDIVARLEGKSSLGRLGLLIHSTAGYVDPGWDGRLTLELSNVANLPIVPELPTPPELYQLDPARVIGLKLDLDRLLAFRRRRISQLGIPAQSAYTDPDRLEEEMRAAQNVFQRGGFYVINVTDKTVEVSADEVIKRISPAR